jgi:signal peptidase I
MKLQAAPIKLRTWYTMKKMYLNSDSHNSIDVEILGNSMAPLLKKHDRVTIKSTIYNPVQIGSTILFVHFEDHATIHRVISIKVINGETYYRTKGDVNSQKDYYLVSENEVIGIVVS